MICNQIMKKHLSKLKKHRTIETKIDLCDFENIILPNIYEKENLKGETYYCINNFCGLNSNGIPKYSNTELTDFEWDGNEVHSNQEILKSLCLELFNKVNL